MGEIIAVDMTIALPAGTCEQILTTPDWTPLEPAVVPERRYTSGVGHVAETKVQGADGRIELIESIPSA